MQKTIILYAYIFALFCFSHRSMASSVYYESLYGNANDEFKNFFRYRRNVLSIKNNSVFLQGGFDASFNNESSINPFLSFGMAFSYYEYFKVEPEFRIKKDVLEARLGAYFNYFRLYQYKVPFFVDVYAENIFSSSSLMVHNSSFIRFGLRHFFSKNSLDIYVEPRLSSFHDFSLRKSIRFNLFEVSNYFSFIMFHEDSFKQPSTWNLMLVYDGVFS